MGGYKTKKINFNKGWIFTFDKKLEAYNAFGYWKYNDAMGAPAAYYDHSNWEHIDLPHDFAVRLPKDISANVFAGGRATSHYNFSTTEYRSNLEDVYNIGWYRKQFFADPAWEGKRIFIEFEGVFRDSVVWVNGTVMGRHNSGYTSFCFDITDHLHYDADNSVAVRVDSEQHEGWWYEGAGIYRNVYLHICEGVYFKHNKTVITTEIDGKVCVTAQVVNDTDTAVNSTVTYEILDGDDTIASASSILHIESYGTASVTATLLIESPKLWHVDRPNLYRLRISTGDEMVTESFGVRTVSFDAERGFLLNGEPLKIRGACVHQDFGGVGTALTDNLQYYKIKRLKEMGVNAYRSAHHAPSPVLLRACDELGMLVMDEVRLFGTSDEAVSQLIELIERDRNHPSVFIWSLGNEEFNVQNDEWSYRLLKKATRIAKGLDATRPTTYGGNNQGIYTGANSAAEVRGVNYIQFNYDWVDKYHVEHPEQPIIGTEESSYILSRGGAHNDLGSGQLDSTGNVTMPWGTTPKRWVTFSETRPYFAGSFMWTGFDYRGEPNPFVVTKFGSAFGAIDLCGMEKPPFYYYKSWWTDGPVLKLTPHWNHRSGERVTMAVFTNCERITLFVNGKEIESRDVARFDAPLFCVDFEVGEILVEGERDGRVYRDSLRTSGKTAEIRMTPILSAMVDGDIAIYQLEAYDSDGVFCPLGDEKVEIFIENGEIVGVGNGDPACEDYEQKPLPEESSAIHTFDCEGELYSVPLKAQNRICERYDWLEDGGCEGFPRTVAKYVYEREAKKTVTLTTKVSGASRYEYIEFERLGGASRVYLNGTEIGNNLRNNRTSYANVRPYRFYAEFKEGENVITVVSVQSEQSSPPVSGYVKLGRTPTDDPWQVRLHYGLARVFVKSAMPDAVKITARLE